MLSDGPFASDFIETFCRVTKGAGAGSLITLRPWQRQLLTDLLAIDPETGLRRHRRGLVGIARKNGKALDVSTPILTANGWKKMGELAVGDFVHAPDGSLTRIKAVSQRWFGQAFKVQFADGAELVASPEHEWTVNDRRRQKVRTIETTELRDTLTYGARGDRRYSVDVPAAIERDEQSLLIDPYVFGVWLGDGSSSAGQITTPDPEIVQRIQNVGYKTSKGRPKGNAETLTIYGLQTELRKLGVLGKKWVPEAYLLGSQEQRRRLLAGILDTDGTVELCGGGAPRVVLTITNENIARAALFLARSLGYKATIHEGRASLYGKDCGPVWDVAFNAYKETTPFFLERQTSRLRLQPERLTRSSNITIKSVEPSDVECETVCITVEHPSGMFLAGASLTPTHNSALGAGLALWALVADDEPGAEVYSVAGSREQARIVFETASRMVELDPELSKIVKRFKYHLEFPMTGGVYRCLSAEASQAEGLNPHCVIFDELHVQPNDKLWNVMTLGSGTRRQPLTLGITTAGVKTDVTGQDSICYRLYQYGKKLERGEVDDSSFFFKWFEPKNPEADHHDTSIWPEANPAIGDFLSVVDFESAIKTTPENEFRTKRLNQWVSSQQAWLPQGKWDACKEYKEIPDGATVVLSFDGSYSGDSTGILATTVEANPHQFVVGHWERTQNDPQDWRVDIAEVEQAIREACAKYNVLEVACDPFRWARSMQALENEGWPIVEWNTSSPARMVPACAKFYDVVSEGRITHDGDPRLARHIDNCVLKTDRLGPRIVKDNKNSPRKIDLAVCAVVGIDRATFLNGTPDEEDPFFFFA